MPTTSAAARLLFSQIALGIALLLAAPEQLER
jgi:hypothetical protein